MKRVALIVLMAVLMMGGSVMKAQNVLAGEVGLTQKILSIPGEETWQSRLLNEMKHVDAGVWAKRVCKAALAAEVYSKKLLPEFHFKQPISREITVLIFRAAVDQMFHLQKKVPESGGIDEVLTKEGLTQLHFIHPPQTYEIHNAKEYEVSLQEENGVGWIQLRGGCETHLLKDGTRLAGVFNTSTYFEKTNTTRLYYKDDKISDLDLSDGFDYIALSPFKKGDPLILLPNPFSNTKMEVQD